MTLYRSTWDEEIPQQQPSSNGLTNLQSTEDESPKPRSNIRSIHIQLLGVAGVLFLIFALVLTLSLVLTNIKTNS